MYDYVKQNVQLNFIIEKNNGTELIGFKGSPNTLKDSKNDIIEISKELINPLDQIQKGKELLESGAITQEQFEIIKDTYLNKL